MAFSTLFTLYAAARRWEEGARWRVGFAMLYACLGGLNTVVNSELARPGPNVWSVWYGAMGGVGTYWGLYGLFTLISSPVAGKTASDYRQ